MKSIQSSLHYFFRATQDSNYTQNRYLVIFCLLVWAIVFFVSYKKNIRQLNSTFIRLMGATLFIMQVSVCAWLFFIRTDSMNDSLPLYFCRMSSIVIGAFIMIGKIRGKIVNFFAYFSVFGASIALLVPDMEKYNFPHFTGISFILIHSLLLFESMYVIRTSGTNLSKSTIIKIAAGIIIPIHIFNIVCQSNYSYTMELPSILSVIPQQVAALFIVASTFTIVVVVQGLKNSGEAIKEVVNEKIMFVRNR